MISTLRIFNSQAQFSVYLVLIVALLIITFPLSAAQRCVPEGQWLNPNDASVLNDEQALQGFLKSPILLFGEHHQNAFHHQWHLTWLQKLNEKIEHLEIAIEMLPKQSQPIIDQWMHDKLSDEEFIKKSDWNEYWQHDVNLYLPVLKYAKAQKIPIHAINVSKQLFKEVSRNGWKAIPIEQREGLTDPGPASRAYLKQLARSFRRHALPSGEDISPEEGARFRRFIDVQLLWDRAMAEGIAQARKQKHAPVIMAMMGSGHMMHQFGTPIQLDDMGHSDYTVIVPWDDHLHCDELKPGFADLVFGSPPNAR